MSKIELRATIRCDHRSGRTLREIERNYNPSWRTVRKAVDSVWPEPRKKLPPLPTVLDAYKPLIDGIPASEQADGCAAQAAAHRILLTASVLRQ
ncbi:hypothetical protein ACWEN3_38010 [Streptomyces sp. NPDC004561]